MTYDIIIVGGGHNGLVAAAYLGKAGLKTIVLERREVIGGASVTDEIHPGFRCSVLAHSAGPLAPQVVSDLNLSRHGFETITTDVCVLALGPNGKSICIYNDTSKTAAEIEKFSTADAKSYPKFVSTFERIGRVLSPLLSMTPPSIEHPSAADVWQLGKVGLAFRGLGKTDEYRLLRWGPMAVADLVAEWFETELLRAAVAARGIFGAFAGPWSAGTSLGLLWQSAHDGRAIAAASFVAGGMGALTKSIANAAEAAGVEIKTAARVSRIEAGDGSKTAKVILESGEEIEARAIISNADPRTTFLDLIDPIDLNPNFLSKVKNYRAVGSTAKINLALSELPSFNGIEDSNKLSGRIHVGPDIDYLERAFDAAKYGDFSAEPYLDITIPSLTDSSLAPTGKHVMSIHVQFAPYTLRAGDWHSREEEFADNVMRVLEQYAPGIQRLTLGRQVFTPASLEHTFALSGGHIHHGEQSLDQFFTFRPLIGWAQYRTPLTRLYLCGAGTHPGGGVTGLPGANAAREVVRDVKAKRI